MDCKKPIIAIECLETEELKHGDVFDISPDSPGIQNSFHRKLCAENSFMAVPLDRSKWWDKKIRIANLGRGVA
ncbi:MAG: hypothetical protein IM607_07840 [Cytophagales bacterium]|jgi:hypothetical protein|nr:hypothetical protein [Cytophagales bacterium]